MRTLQRRVREWRALAGPERLLCFPQEHPPGEQLIADFTVMDAVAVRIAGQPLPHRLLHARLPCSGWAFATVAAATPPHAAHWSDFAPPFTVRFQESIKKIFLENADEFLGFMSKTETDSGFGKFFFSEMFGWYAKQVKK